MTPGEFKGLTALRIYWFTFGHEVDMTSVRTVYGTATAFVMHGMEYHVGLKGNPQGIERVQCPVQHPRLRDA